MIPPIMATPAAMNVGNAFLSDISRS
jgi:hypothetical protein